MYMLIDKQSLMGHTYWGKHPVRPSRARVKVKKAITGDVFQVPDSKKIGDGWIAHYVVWYSLPNINKD
jgi:hypothetical protein